MKKEKFNKKLIDETDYIIIYMKEKLSIDSKIEFFTEDLMVYDHKGVRYIQFFPIEYAVDLVESDLELKDRGYTNLQIATRLLEYRIYDA